MLQIDPILCEQLSQFRQSPYKQPGKAKDAAFGLMDGVLVSARACRPFMVEALRDQPDRARLR